MTFTPAEHAKPKVPHKEGLACVECGARETSQWRGIGGRYCSAAGCRKLADKERKLVIEGRLSRGETRRTRGALRGR